MKKNRIRLWLFGLLLALLCLGGALSTLAGAGTLPGTRTFSAVQAKKKTKKKKKNNNNNNSNNEQNQHRETEKTKPDDDQADDQESSSVTVEKNGEYTSKEEVAAYLNEFGHLPGNFITKKEAKELGWVSTEGNLNKVAPGKSIGGDYFGNYEEILPVKKGRSYYECDIDYVSGSRGAKRIIYSNDGYIYYTGDHYNTFEQLYPESKNGQKIILGRD